MTTQSPTHAAQAEKGVDERRCDLCLWWQRSIKTVLMGECRRMPPQPADNLVDPRWWPSTHRDDWCGEFNAAVRPQEKQT